MTEKKEDETEKLISEGKLVSAMLETEGWRIMQKAIELEIHNAYLQLGTCDDNNFQKIQGRLIGLSFVPNLINSYKTKIKKLSRSSPR